MDEKRIAPRLEEENEVTISVISSRKNLPKEKIIFNYIKDVSVSGAKLQTNILLPVDRREGSSKKALTKNCFLLMEHIPTCLRPTLSTNGEGIMILGDVNESIPKR